MRMTGTQDKLWEQVATPDIAADVARTEHIRGKMFPYQYAAVYRLANQYEGGNILEIGGFLGRSALVMSLAAPRARIVSLEPYLFKEAHNNTAGRGNVKVIKEWSWRYLTTTRLVWDMILVDGNHHRIVDDLPWFNRLKTGGLILFHDYTPNRCLRVYVAINSMAKALGRVPDVLIVDDEQFGMAGFYRQDAERLSLCTANRIPR